jgi:hypothetical protein
MENLQIIGRGKSANCKLASSSLARLKRRAIRFANHNGDPMPAIPTRRDHRPFDGLERLHDLRLVWPPEVQGRAADHVILVSWGIAFFEYVLQVPANRIGSTSFRPPS